MGATPGWGGVWVLGAVPVGGRRPGFLFLGTFGPLAFWPFDLLAFWPFGLLAFRPFDLLAIWPFVLFAFFAFFTFGAGFGAVSISAFFPAFCLLSFFAVFCHERARSSARLSGAGGFFAFSVFIWCRLRFWRAWPSFVFVISLSLAAVRFCLALSLTICTWSGV